MTRPTDRDDGRPARAVFSPSLIVEANSELLTLVRNRLPERFYQGEPRWRMLGTALVARIARMVESINVLISAGSYGDAVILVRSLYEYVLTFCWIAIKPETRVPAWRDHAVAHLRTLHREVAAFGVELMSEAELAEADGVQRFIPLDQVAGEIDEFWSARTTAFRPPVVVGAGQLLTLKGLYSGLYRVASRTAHAHMQSVDDCLDLSRFPARPAVVHWERSSELTIPALSSPLFAMALIVCHYRFGWPDPEYVKRINDELMREPPDGYPSSR